MGTTRVSLLIGVAAILFGCYAGVADAQTEQTHLLTLRLPNGQVEQVQYTGDVPPTVILGPAAVPASFYAGDPFAVLERISADMDRQVDALFRRLDATTAANTGVIPAMAGPGVCMRSVQVTFAGNGQPPRVVSQSSGDCAPVRNEAEPTALPNEPAPKRVPNVIEVKAIPPGPGLIHTVADWQHPG